MKLFSKNHRGELWAVSPGNRGRECGLSSPPSGLQGNPPTALWTAHRAAFATFAVLLGLLAFSAALRAASPDSALDAYEKRDFWEAVYTRRGATAPALGVYAAGRCQDEAERILQSYEAQRK